MVHTLSNLRLCCVRERTLLVLVLGEKEGIPARIESRKPWMSKSPATSLGTAVMRSVTSWPWRAALIMFVIAVLRSAEKVADGKSTEVGEAREGEKVDESARTAKIEKKRMVGAVVIRRARGWDCRVIMSRVHAAYMPPGIGESSSEEWRRTTF